MENVAMKQRIEPGKSYSKGDENLLKQWKKEKAAKAAKNICLNVLCGMANGLSMYGRVMPIILFPPAPAVNIDDLKTKYSKY